MRVSSEGRVGGVVVLEDAKREGQTPLKRFEHESGEEEAAGGGATVDGKEFLVEDRDFWCRFLRILLDVLSWHGFELCCGCHSRYFYRNLESNRAVVPSKKSYFSLNDRCKSTILPKKMLYHRRQDSRHFKVIC